WQLFPPYPGEAPASGVDFSKLYADLGIYRAAAGTKTSVLSPLEPARQSLAAAAPHAMQAWADAFVRDAGTLEGKGSNNWAVAGGLSKSGKPLVANDPHLGLSAPAIWYFARLQAPGLDVVGATLPGLPFVIIGRTQRVAWGFTNTAPDVQDLYIEQINPSDARQYRTPDGWAEFKTRVERIKVKNGADVNLTVRETRHGPVLSDAQSAHGDVLDLKSHVLALRWSALDADNRTLVAGLRSNTARSVGELFDAYADYHSPTQSAVAADVDGRVGFKVVGRVPLRRSDNDIRGMAPSPGWDARYDWAGWIPYAQTPQDDGARGWVATANQRITPPGYPYFMGQDWNLPDRHDRIEQMLAATPKHDMESMRSVQGDQLSLATRRLLPVLQATVSSHPLAAAAQAQLKGFDSVMRADSAAPLIFSVWADELTRGLIVPRLGQARFDAMYGKRNFRSAVEDIMERGDAFWCGAGGCAAQSAAALARALSRIEQMQGADPAQWRWGKAHPAISVHRPFGNVPALARFFDVRVPTGGDAATVNVAQYWANDPRMPFANRHAASLRVLYDLSNLENSQFIYQTGQSGLVFSGRYRDMSAQWAAMQYRPLQLKPSKIEHTLTLKP
ncbi:MAG: penicillin acylase family protein, partial [Burkholderiaceae bacterium]|nr:penicillin acylase family protein [Burkholderiaceae bacterium]